jgi:hypothetical protein
VADTTDQGNGTSGDGPCYPFVVEGDEILNRATAPHQQQQVAFAALAGHLEGLDDLLGRRLALDLDRIEDHRQRRPTALEHAEHIPDGGPGGRGDDADALGKGRQGELAPGVE